MSTTFNKVSAFITAAFCLASFTAGAQTLLDDYIHEAFRNNNGLRQQSFQLDRSIAALREARSYFLPNISLQGSYTKAEGGRSIDLPLGDLFNPVYSTLNQLTASNKFPQLSNQSVQFNPDNFYDAKFRTTLPLVNAEIWYNKEIKKQMITSQQAAVNVYKRELAKDVKTAYYQYVQSNKAIDIYNNALLLIRENIRVNESLLRNGVRNSTALTRSQAELQKMEALLNQAENNRKNAKAYFNFLRNAPLDKEITLDSSMMQASTGSYEAARSDNREELQQLKTTLGIYNINTQLQRAYIIPKLNTFLDLGSQGFGQYDNKTRYYLWGVSLQWDLFAGGQHHYKTQQSKAEAKTIQARYDETAQALQLQLEQSVNNYNTAVSNYKSARSQETLAVKYYNDQLKVYKEGQLLYIELLDAQNQLTNAQLQCSLALADMQICTAEIERNNASYPIH